MSLFKPPSYDIDKRISTLVDTVTRLTVTVEKVTTKHDALSESQDIIAKRVSTNEQEIRNLQTSTAKIDTVSNLAKYGGIAIITSIAAGWNALSTKVEVVTTKTDSNAQNITHLQKDMLDDQKQIDVLATKVSENRENILTQLKNKEDKK